jgi:hypothetical protein
MAVDERGTLNRFVEIACLEPTGHPALDVIAEELLAALQAGASIARIGLVENVLARWKRFWSGTNQGALTRNDQVGLFGELWFLSRWLCASSDLNKVVPMWKGPNRARHDFESPTMNAEVKTTSGTDGIHMINGLEQLLEPSSGVLFLFSLSVREEGSGTECLPSLVNELRTKLQSNDLALSHFETTLYDSRYEDRFSAEYSKMLLRVRAQELFRVQGAFPRLVPSSIQPAIPPGIGTVQYQLVMAAAAPWVVATNPDRGSKLLADMISR